MTRPATVTRIGRSRHESAPLSEARERLTEDANPREVAKAVGAMPQEVLECRRLRHAWEARVVDKIRGGFSETMVCTRCGASKDRMYNSRGRVTEYGPVTYPEGYLLKGLGRMGEDARDVIMLTSLRVSIERGSLGGSFKSRR